MQPLEDLQLKGKQFNTVSTVFFPTYIVFEIPWVLAIKRFGISRVFAVSMVGWGVITLGTGFVQSFEQLVAVRVLLGIFEASVIPSIVFTISMIWEPSAQAKPVSVYYLGACTSGAIGGLIAYAVQTMGEQHGLEAWRWLFIIEGIISAVLCSVFLITMPLSPERAWFLDESEREAMRQRKERNLAIRGTDKFDWTYFRHAMTNPLVWLGALALFSNTIPLLGLSIFLPTLLSGLGYKGLQLQYLTIPVWVVGAFFLVLTTFASDKFKRRGFWLMSLPLPTIVGYAMLIGSSNKVVGYVAMFIVGPGRSSPSLLCKMHLTRVLRDGLLQCYNAGLDIEQHLSRLQASGKLSCYNSPFEHCWNSLVANLPCESSAEIHSRRLDCIGFRGTR